MYDTDVIYKKIGLKAVTQHRGNYRQIHGVGALVWTDNHNKVKINNHSKLYTPEEASKVLGVPKEVFHY